MPTPDSTPQALPYTIRGGDQRHRASLLLPHHHQPVRDDDVVLELRARAVIHGSKDALPEGRRPVVHVGSGFSVHEPKPKPAVRFPCLFGTAWRDTRQMTSCMGNDDDDAGTEGGE